MAIATTNPATAETVREFDALSEPFGGAKNSGYGRELAGFGPQSFVNATTVWVQ